jgi:hypothetical protein
VKAAVWPVGLLLTMLYAGAGVLPLPLFVLLDAAYVAMVYVAYRRAGRALPLLVAGAGIFAIVAFTGIPTARAPQAMLANAALLLAAAVLVLVGVCRYAARLRSPLALLAVVALSIGSAGYLANLLARFAVVLAGAAPAQAAVEDQAWQAHAYLVGLPGEPSTLTILLVWLDLLQVAYCALAYVAIGLLALALVPADVVSARAGWRIAGAAGALTALVVLGATLAVFTGSEIGAWTVFVLTIPFMSTLLPNVLGQSILAHTPQPALKPILES